MLPRGRRGSRGSGFFCVRLALHFALERFRLRLCVEALAVAFAVLVAPVGEPLPAFFLHVGHLQDTSLRMPSVLAVVAPFIVVEEEDHRQLRG